jgi:hypothetical protein
MFSMTIVFGAAPVPWTLLFKTQQAFNEAIINLKNPSTFENATLDITDDYGQHICISRSAIQGVMFEDMSKSKLAHIERGLHQMRAQIDADNMVRADPALSEILRRQRMAQQQPGVITPFSPNGAFRQ